MKNMSVKSKLRIFWLIVVAVVLVLGSIGVYGMIRTSNNQAKMYTISENNNDAYKLVTLMLNLRIDLRQTIVYARQPDEVEKLIAEMEQIDREFAETAEHLARRFYIDATVDRLRDAQAQYNKFSADREAFEQMARQGDEAGMVAWLEAHMNNALEIQDICEDLNARGMQLAAETDHNDNIAALWLTGLMMAFSIVSIVGAVVLGQRISTLIATPVRKMADAAEHLAVGDLDVDVMVDSEDEVGRLSRSFQNMVEAIRMQADIVEKVSKGDYTVSIPLRSDKDVMNRAVRTLVKKSNQVMTQIRSSSDQVSSGANQISDSAQTLSAGASEQAASVEQFSVALSQVLEQTRHNAASARDALDMTFSVCRNMEEGTTYMHEMQEAMRSIDDSSQSVAKVIKVIEDIAFQTNILALNAAVEAARAGQHGRGFAVVADEVRNLASKSAAAAKETSSLIAGSRERVNDGNAIVDRTSGSLSAAADHSNQALGLITQISEASSVQASAIAEIEAGIEQITRVVQDNSATAEESAASAEEMAAQAELLQRLVSTFRIVEQKGYDVPSMPAMTAEPPSPPQEGGFALAHGSKY